jgi:hypothetical protein
VAAVGSGAVHAALAADQDEQQTPLALRRHASGVTDQEQIRVAALVAVEAVHAVLPATTVVAVGICQTKEPIMTDFSTEQMRRFINRYGEFDADRRMRTIGYQYIAAKTRFDESAVPGESAPIFVFGGTSEPVVASDGRVVETPQTYYPHIYEPWRLFRRLGGIIQVYDGEAFGLGVPTGSTTWETVCSTNSLNSTDWTAVRDSNGKFLGLALFRAADGTVYGCWY